MIEKTDYTKYDIYKFGIRGSIKFFVPKNKQDTDGPIIEVKCTKCGKFKTINITWDEYQTWIERGKPIYVALQRLSDSDKIWLILNRCEECM